ncbi:ABC transporter substrate-binding protein [archaeon]|nr:ABC transporter substrate-binding protein [archaeon]
MEKGLQVLIGVLIVLVVVFGVTLAVWPGEQPVKSTAKATTKVAKQPAEIKLGVIMPLTGDAATLGQNMLKAMQLAVDEVNAEGGIKGAKLKLIAEDGKCGGKDASNSAQKLVNIDKVPVILGGQCSSETLAVAPITEAAKVLTISQVSSNPSITDAGDYIFRVYPSDSYEGSIAAQFAKDTLGAKKVAILYCQGDWCVGLKDEFKKTFVANGGTIVAEEAYEQASRDLRSQLTKIKAKNADTLYFIGYTEASIVGLKQIEELGMTEKILGGDAWDDPKIWTDAGSAGDGAIYLTPSSPVSDAFKAKLKSTIGLEEVTLGVPQSYDSVKLVAQLMRQFGTDSTVLKDALYDLDYNGVSGRIQFDQNGDFIGAEYDVKIAQDGKTSVLQ